MKHNGPHIIYIITKLELGGAQKVCLSLFESNEHATLITGTDGPLVARVANKPNAILIKELTREVSFFGFLNELRCFLKLVSVLWKLKKKYPHAVVHTHSTKAGLLGRWAAAFTGIRTRIHTIHGYAFHAHQNKIAWLLIYIPELITSFITSHFICVSSADVKTGIRLFPWFANKHSIIRAAVECPSFIPAKTMSSFSSIRPACPAKLTELEGPDKRKREGPFIFGTIACFKPQKNLFDLLYAFEYTYKQNPQVRLEIIGDGHMRPALEQWIFEHKLNKVITLHGWQDHVALIMMHWHVFCLTSLWEGLPCAIIEARLQKLPVISYDTGGIHDVITHGANGFLYPQKEWKAVAQGMLELSKNQQLHEQLGKYQDRLDDFKISAMVEEHKKLYREI